MANFDSSSIKRLGFPKGPGVYPVKDVGTITIASNTTIGSGAPDALRICYIPPNSILTNWVFAFPVGIDAGGTLGLKLVDTLTTTTTYIASILSAFTSTGGILIMGTQTGGAVIADGATWYSQYGQVTRAIGTSGTPVKVWASGAILQFTCTTSGTNTSGASALNISYMVEWSPMTDGGPSS